MLTLISCVLLSAILVTAVTLKRVERVSHQLPLSAYRADHVSRDAALHHLVSRRSIKNACDYVVDLMDLPRGQCDSRSYEREISAEQVRWISRVRAARTRTLSWTGFRKHLRHLEEGSSIYLPAPILNAVFDDLCDRLKSRVCIVNNEGDEPLHQHTIHRLKSCPFIDRVYSCNWPLNIRLPENFHSIPLGYQCDDEIRYGNGYAWELRKNIFTSTFLPEGGLPQAPSLTVENFHGPWVPVRDRPTRVLCAVRGKGGQWTVPDIREQCRTYFRAHRELGYVVEKSLPVRKYFCRHRDFAFEISPFGGGVDCFRTWEALLLGTIPIVFDAPNRDVFAGLPVLIINEIREITTDLLRETHHAFAPWWDENPAWRDELTAIRFLRDITPPEPESVVRIAATDEVRV